jgi:hypothetical protein
MILYVHFQIFCGTFHVPFHCSAEVSICVALPVRLSSRSVVHGASLVALFLSFLLQKPRPQGNVSLKNRKFTFHHPSKLGSQKYFVITGILLRSQIFLLTLFILLYLDINIKPVEISKGKCLINL